MSTLRLLSVLVLPLLSLCAIAQTPGLTPPATAPTQPPPTPQKANPSLPTLWLIGDSTVRNGKGDGARGQWGWGEPIVDLFDTSRLNVVNRALGGRSTRTFIAQGHWERVLQDASPGDFILIQFGHNDSSPINDDSRARGTIPGIGDESQEIDNLLTHQRETVYSFGHYLRKFVREAREKKLQPIILSPVPRCPRAPAGGNGFKVPATQPADHALWAKQVAGAEKVPFIDLYSLIWSEYVGREPAELKSSLFCDADYTHTNRVGAELNARKVVEGIRSLPDEVPLRAYLKK